MAIWEKDATNTNKAYTSNSFPNFLFVYCVQDKTMGVFKFPKHILKKQGILGSEKYKGKMAFRVYPNWDHPTSKQAMQTQRWQQPYFEWLGAGKNNYSLKTSLTD